MSGSTEQTITDGFSIGHSWTLGNLDQDLVNLAVARFASLATSQGVALNAQTQTLLAQASNLDAMKDKTANLPNDYLVPLTLDKAGTALIIDPMMVYDLVGATISRLQSSSSDVDRLIKFTQGLVNNSTNVNISDSVIYKLSYTLPDGTQASGNFETTFLLSAPSDPLSLPVNQLYKVSGFDGFYLNVATPAGVKAISIGATNFPVLVDSPPAYLGYDAYRLEAKNSLGIWESRVLEVSEIVSPNPRPSADTLYRWPDGTLKLINSSGQSVEFRNAEGFVIPKSDSQITNWLGQASYDRLQSKLAEIKADGVTFDLTDKTAVEWKLIDGDVRGFANLPAKTVANVTDLPKVTDLKVGELASVGNRYFVKAGVINGQSSFFEVSLDPQKAFQLYTTPQNLIALKGAYSEVVLKLTQRSAEQQLFLNQLINKNNYQFDAATFVLKALTEMQQKLSNL